MFPDAETLWVDRFVQTLKSLARCGPMEQFRALAYELYPDLNLAHPEQVAQVEWEESLRNAH